MKTRLLSVLFVFLLLSSVSIPAVSAIPVADANPAVCLAPAAVKLAVDGIGVAVATATALGIAEMLGKTWDNTREGLEQLIKDTSNALAELMHNRGKWVYATSDEAKAVLDFDYHTAVSGSGDGDKKNETLYHKAERNEKTGKIKINTKRISKDDAVKELREGRDIFTATNPLAKSVMEKAFGEENIAMIENHGIIKGRGYCKKGYYDHFHPENQPVHPHCWIWEDL